MADHLVPLQISADMNAFMMWQWHLSLDLKNRLTVSQANPTTDRWVLVAAVFGRKKKADPSGKSIKDQISAPAPASPAAVTSSEQKQDAEDNAATRAAAGDCVAQQSLCVTATQLANKRCQLLPVSMSRLFEVAILLLSGSSAGSLLYSSAE